MRVMLDTNVIISFILFNNERMNLFFNYLLKIVKNVKNKKLFKIRDEKDYGVLYAAIVSKVDLFITGDEDFKEVDIEIPKIMTIKDYILTYIIK